MKSGEAKTITYAITATISKMKNTVLSGLPAKFTSANQKMIAIPANLMMSWNHFESTQVGSHAVSAATMFSDKQTMYAIAKIDKIVYKAFFIFPPFI